ncbi:uncharacterized protein [Amphiura filiformis]|uniref:uncharacterized protein isoform X2 n=1 Tax=Amphiura filiformis TaxID=82378 RepID=UPI003B21A013
MCTDCKMFFGDVQKVLMDPNNQQTILSAVEQVCSLLGDLSSECQSLVEQYGSTVINAVAQVLDPQNTCNTIGFCGMLPKLRVKAGDPCTDCKAFFGDVKMMLSNATTQKEILNELKMVCSLLGDLADQCNSLIDQYGPLVFDLLLPELDPTSICGTIGFCQGVDTTQMIAALTRVVIKVKMLPTADMCTDCKMFFGDVQKVLMDPNNQQTIISAVEQVCSLLGDLSSECQSLVEQYGSTVINAVAQVLDPQNTCSTIGFCTGTPRIRMKLGDQCSDCQAFFKDVQAMLQNSTVQNQILMELEQVCSVLGQYESECKSLLQQYGPLAFNLIVSQLNPTTVCGGIGFCESTNMHAFLVTAVKAATYFTMVQPKVTGDMCADCKAFFGDVEKELTNPSNQELIISEVIQLCDQLGQYSSECQMLVHQYGQTVITAIAQALGSSNTCSTLGFCGSQPKTWDKSGDVCTDCKNFFTDVQNMLKDPTLQTQVLHDLEKVCSLLGSYSTQCTSLIDQYGPIALTLIISELDPSTICGAIHYCQSDPQSIMAHILLKSINEGHKVLPTSDECTDCTAFFGDVQDLFANYTVQQMLIKDLDQICNIFADPLSCKQMIEEYGGQVFDFLAGQIDMGGLCKTIGFCMGKQRVKAADPCTDCQNFFKDVQMMLQNSTVQNQILMELEQVCSVLGQYESECKSLLQQYGPLVINLVVSQLTPSNVCGTIGFCQSVPVPQLSQFIIASMNNLQGDACTDCEAFFGDIQKMLMDPVVDKEILSTLEDVCSLLGSLESQCKSMIGGYGNMVLEVVVNLLKPETVCKTIKYCPAAKRQTILAMSTPQVKAGDPCTDCKAFFGDVKMMLSNATTQKEILNELKMVCSLLGDLADQCNSLIDQYGPLVFDLLLPELDPTSICGTIGFCQGVDTKQMIAALTRVIIKMRMQPTADMCTDCKMFFGDVQKVLMDPNNQQTILSAVEQVCSLLGDLSSECQSLVEQYGSTVINAVAQVLDPMTTCSTIGFCASTPVPSKPSVQAILRQNMPVAETPADNIAPVVGKQMLDIGDVGDDTFCTLCEILVGIIETQLTLNKTEEEILKIIGEVCTVLPGTLKLECAEFVDAFGPPIIAILVTDIEPWKFCTTLGLCTSDKTVQQTSAQAILRQNMVVAPVEDIPPVDMDEDVDSDTYCTICNVVMGIVEQQLTKNATEDEIIKAVDEVCKLLPGSLQLECNEFITAFGPALIAILTTEIDPSKICTTLGLCPKYDTVAEVDDGADTKCVLCEFVMKELDELIGNNATEQEIKADLEKVCSYLPTSIQDECTRLVDDYAVEIIDLLVKGLSPQMICTEIKLCSQTQKSVSIPGPQCAICKMVLGKLADMLTSNKTEAEIEKALEKVCSVLPSEYAKDCDDFVTKYTATIIQLLTHEVAPEAVCALIQLCSTQQQQVVLVKPTVDADPQCALCEFIMKEVDSLLSDNATESEITAALSKVCSLLPNTIQSECDSFVEKYVPAIINLLVKQVSPDQICSLLKFCTSKSVPLKEILLTKATKVVPKQVAAKKVDADENCALCEFVLKEIDQVLSQNATEEEITKVVENICPILPGTLQEQCKSFLDTYGPTLVTLIVQQLDPKKICTAIGLCSKSTKLYKSSPLSGPIKANDEECAFCEFIMSELKDLITKNSTEENFKVTEEIKTALDDVCSILPSKFKTSCLLFVSDYADAICQLIASGIDPTQICTSLGFCSNTITTTDDECDLCQILVKFVDDYIRSNATEEEIVKGLLDICTILPDNIKSECTDIVNQYGTVIPGLIAELLSPLKVCEAISICKQTKLDLCSKGPSEWCASMDSAKMCNAVVHCQRHVWN